MPGFLDGNTSTCLALQCLDTCILANPLNKNTECIAYFHTVAAQEGPGIVIAHPGQDVELLCNVTGGVSYWRVNNVTYTLSQLFTGQLAGHNSNGSNIIVEDIMMNDDRNGSVYICLIPQTPPVPDIVSSPTILYIAGEYGENSMILTIAITYVSNKN